MPTDSRRDDLFGVISVFVLLIGTATGNALIMIAMSLATLLLMVLFGAAIVGVHNDWSIGWGLPVTALGWILLLKGVAFLAFPKVAALGATLRDGVFIAVIRIAGVAIAPYGLLLVCKAWFGI